MTCRRSSTRPTGSRAPGSGSALVEHLGWVLVREPRGLGRGPGGTDRRPAGGRSAGPGSGSRRLSFAGSALARRRVGRGGRRSTRPRCGSRRARSCGCCAACASSTCSGRRSACAGSCHRTGRSGAGSAGRFDDGRWCSTHDPHVRGASSPRDGALRAVRRAAAPRRPRNDASRTGTRTRSASVDGQRLRHRRVPLRRRRQAAVTCTVKEGDAAGTRVPGRRHRVGGSGTRVLTISRLSWARNRRRRQSIEEGCAIHLHSVVDFACTHSIGS